MGLAACLGVIALSAGGAVADDSAPLVQATVYGANGQPTPDSVSPAYLLAHASQCPLYSGGTMQEYGRTGPEPIIPNPASSWTLGTVLGCLQTPIALADVTGVTVIGSDGQPQTGANSQIIPGDLASPSDFINTAQNPVVESVGYNEYDRPQRNASDLDYLDDFQTNAPIAIDVFEGPPLTVKASASQTTVTVGGTIDFSEVVTGNNGSALSYSWNFGGGAAPSGQELPHIQFDTAGVWTVDLQVTDANGGGGGDQLVITVNPVGSTTSPTTTGKTTTGPDRGGGPTPGGNPVKQKKSGAPGRTHTHGKGSNRPTGSQRQTTSTTPTTTTQTTTTPAAGSSGGSSGGGSPGASSASSPTTTAGPTATDHRVPAAPTHRPSPPAPHAPSTLVDGQLVSDVVALPADRSPLVHTLPVASGSAPARQAPEHRSPLAIIGAALAILALLGLGAQRELGRPRWWRLLHVSG